jgi:hypothetical protein
MANPDRPRGFTPVRHINGGSWNNALAVRALVDDEGFDEAGAGAWTIGIGTAVQYNAHEDAGAGNLATLPSVLPLVDEDASGAGLSKLVYGVVVGIGNAASGDTLIPGETGPWDADLLGGPNLVTPAEIEADVDAYVLYIAPAKDWIFEIQNDSAEVLGVGVTGAVNTASSATVNVNQTTGRDQTEFNLTADEVQLRIVEIPEYPDNDAELANARAHVMFVDAWPVAESQ